MVSVFNIEGGINIALNYVLNIFFNLYIILISFFISCMLLFVKTYKTLMHTLFAVIIIIITTIIMEFTLYQAGVSFAAMPDSPFGVNLEQYPHVIKSSIALGILIIVIASVLFVLSKLNRNN